MKNFFSAVAKLFNEYTSGWLFVLWMTAGTAVALFSFFSRNYEFVDFNRLKYVLVASAIWAVISDISKRRKLFNRRINFIADSLFYIATYSSIVYLTGGFDGHIFFIFFLAAISAPFFGTLVETTALLIGLSVVTFFVYYLGNDISEYNTNVVLLEISFYFIIAGVSRFLLQNNIKIEREKRVLSEEAGKRCEEDVKIRTRELQETISKLKDSNKKMAEMNKQLSFTQEKLQYTVSELERFNSLAVGRELKMMELKKEITDLKSKIKDVI